MTDARSFDEALTRLVRGQQLEQPFPSAEKAFADFERAGALSQHYDEHRDVAALRESASILEAALAVQPDGSRFRTPFVNLLLHVLNALSVLPEMLPRADHAVDLGRAEITSIEQGEKLPPTAGRSYLELAQALLTRAYATGDIPDATEALAMAQQGVRFASSRADAAAGMLVAAKAALVRFTRQQDPVDLGLTVDFAHQVYTADDVPEPLRGAAHMTVGDAFVIGNSKKALPVEVYDPLGAAAAHYTAAAKLIADPGDLYYVTFQAIAARAKRAVEPYQLSERPVSGQWLVRGNDLRELDACIDAFRAIVPAAPAANRAKSYAELAWALRNRGFLNSDEADLRAARDAQVHAAASAEPGSGQAAALGSALGMMSWEIWRNHGRNPADLTAAYRAWEEADAVVFAGYLDATVGGKFNDAAEWDLMRDGLVEAAVQLDRQQPDGRWARIALERAEGVKSALLRDMVARGSLPRPDRVPPAEFAEERRLLDGLLDLERAELAAGSAGAVAMSGQRRRLVAALRETWQRWERLGLEAQRYVALRRGDRLAAADLADLTISDQALVSLWHRKDGLGAAVLRPGSPTPCLVTAELTQPELAELMRIYRQEVDQVGINFGETWQEPLEPFLAGLHAKLAGMSEVVVSPHGQLQLLPWQALLNRSHGKAATPPTVTVEPALSVYAMLTRRDAARQASRPFSALVFGDPKGNLPFAMGEARRVAAVLGTEPQLGAQATRGAVLDALCSADIVHVAAHGTLSATDPLQSGLVLADGVLTAGDLLAQRLTTRLVVLSACDSGRGTIGGGGELLGLTHALLQAGVSSLVVSQWPVPDQATASLMAAFHQRRAAGQRTAAALRDAAAGIAAVHEQTWFWGAFMVVGLDI